jgi:hypothetical protein
MLVNRGAEAGEETPDGWRSSAGEGNFQPRWSTTVAFEGSRSLAIEGPSEPGGVSDFAFWAQTVTDIARGVGVDLRVAIKLSRVEGNGVAIAIRGDDTERPEGSAEVFATTQGRTYIAGTADWAIYQVSLPPVPAGIRSLTAYLILGGPSSGTVYFDEVSLTEAE